MKFLTIAAMACALGAVANAATTDDFSAVAEASFTELDDELTAEFNAGGEAEAEAEEADIVRRGGGKHYPKPQPPPPAPPAGCCYWKGYAYKPGYWYGQCYCDNGKWTCYKPQPKPMPPPAQHCYYNGCTYKPNDKCYFNKGYCCTCYNGKWVNCQYEKPVYYKKGW